MNLLTVNRLVTICLSLLLCTCVTLHAQQTESGKKDFSIGLLINDDNKREATFAAKYAVDEINTRGGIYGKPLKLVTKSVEGTWGTGSNEVVHMVFQDKVDVILGSIDGRNSHLAEQVIAKTQVLYVSAYASDPTLTQAYVPWYFSLVPTDDQQAAEFSDLLNKEKGHHRILIISDKSYDGSQALKSFKQLSERHQEFDLDELKFESNDAVTALKNRLAEENYDAIVLVGKKLSLPSIFRLLDKEELFIPVYANSQAMTSMDFNTVQNLYADRLMNRLSIRSTATYDNLQTEFKDIYDRESGLIAALVYDGVMLIAEGLKQSGTEAENLKSNVAKIKYQGVTGDIQFDSNGKIKSIHRP